MTEEDRLIAGRYRLIDRIGSGGMGIVWRGRDEQLDRVIAVKELLLHQGLGEAKTNEAKSRTMREARIAARLQHPHAITVYSVVEESDRPWLIMEYLPSKSLSDVLAEKGSLPPEEVARIGHQLASALAAAHQAGIVHRDVKPGNVLIGEDDTVKITDFGISRADGDGTITGTGDIAGTPPFFSPEVARGDKANSASDVFSLGATLYTAVEGEPPFGYGDNAIALLYRVANGTINPPEKAGPLKPILLRLLEKEPEDRPTMAKAVDLLAPLAGAPEKPPTERLATPENPPPGNNLSRRRAVVLVVCLVLVAAGVVAIVLASTAGDNTAGEPPPSTTIAPATTSSAQPPSSSPPPSTPESTSQSPTTTTSTSITPPAPATPEQTISEYFASMAGKQVGYDHLTAGFKAKHAQSFAIYQGFWDDYTSVQATDVTSQGASKVSAVITYKTKGGGTTTDHMVYTMVQQDGVWLIDAQNFG